MKVSALWALWVLGRLGYLFLLPDGCRVYNFESTHSSRKYEPSIVSTLALPSHLEDPYTHFSSYSRRDSAGHAHAGMVPGLSDVRRIHDSRRSTTTVLFDQRVHEWIGGYPPCTVRADNGREFH